MFKKIISTTILSMAVVACLDQKSVAEELKPSEIQIRYDLSVGLKFCTEVSIFDFKKITETTFPNKQFLMYANGVLLVSPPRVKPPITNQIGKAIFVGGCFNQVGAKEDELDLKAKIIKAIETKNKHSEKNLYIEGGLIDVPFTLQYLITKDGYILQSIY